LARILSIFPQKSFDCRAVFGIIGLPLAGLPGDRGLGENSSRTAPILAEAYTISFWGEEK